jgi:hypothetical protein
LAPGCKPVDKAVALRLALGFLAALMSGAGVTGAGLSSILHAAFIEALATGTVPARAFTSHAEPG